MGAAHAEPMAEPPTAFLRAKPQHWWSSTYDVTDGGSAPLAAFDFAASTEQGVIAVDG